MSTASSCLFTSPLIGIPKNRASKFTLTKPKKMATPPSLGMGRLCILSELSGSSTAFRAGAIFLTKGTSKKDRKKEINKIRASICMMPISQRVCGGHRELRLNPTSQRIAIYLNSVRPNPDAPFYLFRCLALLLSIRMPCTGEALGSTTSPCSQNTTG